MMERIAAPAAPLAAIRRRSRATSLRERFLTATIIVLALAAVGTGVSVGAKSLAGVRLWLWGNKAAVVVQSLGMVRDPTAADVAAITAHATFPVTLPSGLPKGTRITMLLYAPADHPESLTLQYQGLRGFRVGVSLVDPAAIEHGEATLPEGTAKPPFSDVYQWEVGGETVVVTKSDNPAADVTRIRSAMLSSTSARALQDARSMLRKIVIESAHGAPPSLVQAAERLAPSAGSSVFVSPESVPVISTLAREGKASLDSRTVVLTDIPAVNGEPQYDLARLQFSRSPIISASGVRAINAVLVKQAAGAENCRCGVLFNEPTGDSNAFRVWVIPVSSRAVVREYLVDRRTLRVRTGPADVPS